jgi:hypothetical protein
VYKKKGKDREQVSDGGDQKWGGIKAGRDSTGM